MIVINSFPPLSRLLPGWKGGLHDVHWAPFLSNVRKSLQIIPNRSQKALQEVVCGREPHQHTRVGKCSVCQIQWVSLHPFTFRALRVPMSWRAVIFFSPNSSASAHSVIHSDCCFFEALQGNALWEASSYYFFPLEPKYLGSSENGLPWNTQHPMERFCLNLELQASQKKTSGELNWELS